MKKYSNKKIRRTGRRKVFRKAYRRASKPTITRRLTQSPVKYTPINGLLRLNLPKQWRLTPALTLPGKAFTNVELCWAVAMQGFFYDQAFFYNNTVVPGEQSLQGYIYGHSEDPQLNSIQLPGSVATIATNLRSINRLQYQANYTTGVFFEWSPPPFLQNANSASVNDIRYDVLNLKVATSPGLIYEFTDDEVHSKMNAFFADDNTSFCYSANFNNTKMYTNLAGRSKKGYVKNPAGHAFINMSTVQNGFNTTEPTLGQPLIKPPIGNAGYVYFMLEVQISNATTGTAITNMPPLTLGEIKYTKHNYSSAPSNNQGMRYSSIHDILPTESKTKEMECEILSDTPSGILNHQLSNLNFNNSQIYKPIPSYKKK